jgi:hypothetical protein
VTDAEVSVRLFIMKMQESQKPKNVSNFHKPRKARKRLSVRAPRRDARRLLASKSAK